ncbi:hypothetical protein [Bacillus sp. 03113]|uniref:hypothetical protein n=1 Tax=Bacillus sp. 03113 TaxID=2578211 RepID=UPI0015E8B318|nr:hypothetical protein [Bacillus sp. 03113]
MISIKEVVGLPFVKAKITFRGKSMKLANVLIDTGSAESDSSFFKVKVKISPNKHEIKSFLLDGIYIVSLNFLL